MLKKIETTSDFLKKITDLQPETGIILGTGLGGLAEQIDIAESVSYEDIPNFAVSTVESHQGRLIFGKLAGKSVVAMQGRFHHYEGYSPDQVTFPVRVMKMLGIRKLCISNAAGSLNPDIPTASLMMIRDHINLLPCNPLTGPNIDSLGPRFPDMSRPYDEKLRMQARDIANNEAIPLHEGVYISVPGPNLETPAEYRYLQTIGADAVGMSTVPEVIVARHMNLPVFAVSVITDECFQEVPEPVLLDHIFAAAAKAEPSLTKLMKKMV